MTTATCTNPPKGWYCTRKPGHDGPCAAWPIVEVIWYERPLEFIGKYIQKLKAK